LLRKKKRLPSSVFSGFLPAKKKNEGPTEMPLVRPSRKVQKRWQSRDRHETHPSR